MSLQDVVKSAWHTPVPWRTTMSTNESSNANRNVDGGGYKSNEGRDAGTPNSVPSGSWVRDLFGNSGVADGNGGVFTHDSSGKKYR
jgi:hypothetical protein